MAIDSSVFAEPSFAWHTLDAAVDDSIEPATLLLLPVDCCFFLFAPFGLDRDLTGFDFNTIESREQRELFELRGESADPQLPVTDRGVKGNEVTVEQDDDEPEQGAIETWLDKTAAPPVPLLQPYDEIRLVALESKECEFVLHGDEEVNDGIDDEFTCPIESVIPVEASEQAFSWEAATAAAACNELKPVRALSPPRPANPFRALNPTKLLLNGLKDESRLSVFNVDSWVADVGTGCCTLTPNALNSSGPDLPFNILHDNRIRTRAVFNDVLFGLQ